MLTAAALIAIGIGVGLVGGLPLIPLASNGEGYMTTGLGGVGWLTLRVSGSSVSGSIIFNMNTGKCGGDAGYLFNPCVETTPVAFMRVGNTLVSHHTTRFTQSTWDIQQDALVEVVPNGVLRLSFVRATRDQFLHALGRYEALLAAYRWCFPKSGSPSRLPSRKLRECRIRIQRASEALAHTPGYV